MDEAAALIEPEIPGLRRYAVSLLRDRTDADDLVQDCLERALSRWPGRRIEGSVKAWLFAIAHNLFLDRLRRERRQPVLADICDIPSLRDPSVDPDGRIALREALACLDTLPLEQRSVLLLVGVEDLSYEEAARVLDIPVGTVMSRLSRARERIRNTLNPPIARSMRSGR